MRDLNETFTVEEGTLVRRVVPVRGRPYRHTCSLETLKAIAHAVDELGDQAVTLEALRDREKLPHTQANVALAFLKERSIVVPVFKRKHRRNTTDAYIDAMTEFHALAWQQEHPGEAT